MGRRTRIIETQPPSAKLFGPVRVVLFEVLDGALVGHRFRLVVDYGRKVRIPYQPRGTYGWEWRAACYEVGGGQVWAAERCDKGIGCDRVLEMIEEDARMMRRLTAVKNV